MYRNLFIAWYCLGVLALCFATFLILMPIIGAEKAADYCSHHPEISAVLTIPAGNVSDLPFGTLERSGDLSIAHFPLTYT